MTANELLVLLGRAWSRLLIFPGGLAAFGLIWLIGLLQKRIWNAGSQLVESSDDSRTLTLSSVVLPWLGLALLPLPLAVALPRQIDIVVVLALLEWPNVLAIRQDLWLGDSRRLAAALNSYPPLLLAVLALAQVSNSLEIAALARPPGETAAIGAHALHWLGALALALALPPALRIGPFAGRTAEQQAQHAPVQAGQAAEQANLVAMRDQAFPHQRPIPSPQSLFFHIGLRLRALGLVALAALPWAGSEGTAIALLRLLGAAVAIAALLQAYDRLARRHAARGWAWAYLALDMLLLLALLAAAYLALQIRLA